jgi:DNA-binding transcriptional regulator GbsR (MarR family)
MINTDGNLYALEKLLAEREEDDERIDLEQLIEDYKADAEKAQELLVSAIWLLTEAMVQLEAGLIREFLNKITSEGRA